MLYPKDHPIMGEGEIETLRRDYDIIFNQTVITLLRRSSMKKRKIPCDLGGYYNNNPLMINKQIPINFEKEE